METKKEEDIRKAYCEYWDKMSKDLQNIALQSDGWIQMRHCIKELREEFSLSQHLSTEPHFNSSKKRPKSLQGIENNMGWIRIESEEYLPKESGDYWVYETNGYIGIRFYLSVPQKWGKYEMEVQNLEVTHWQPIVKPKPPIY